MSIAAFIPVIGSILDRVLPDKAASEQAKLKLAEMAQQGQLAELNSLTELAKGQMAVNQVEAASDGLYKGGWRPAIGYVLALCLAYQFLLQPLLLWGCALWAPEVTPPAIGLDDNLWELMFGMLGLAGWRTLDKRAGNKGGK
jgi:hypothetical protein